MLTNYQKTKPRTLAQVQKEVNLLTVSQLMERAYAVLLNTATFGVKASEDVGDIVKPSQNSLMCFALSRRIAKEFGIDSSLNDKMWKERFGVK